MSKHSQFKKRKSREVYILNIIDSQRILNENKISEDEERIKYISTLDRFSNKYKEILQLKCQKEYEELENIKEYLNQSQDQQLISSEYNHKAEQLNVCSEGLYQFEAYLSTLRNFGNEVILNIENYCIDSCEDINKDISKNQKLKVK